MECTIRNYTLKRTGLTVMLLDAIWTFGKITDTISLTVKWDMPSVCGLIVRVFSLLIPII